MGLGGSFASAQEEAELEQCHIDRDTLLVMLESLAQGLTALGFEMASFVFETYRGDPQKEAWFDKLAFAKVGNGDLLAVEIGEGDTGGRNGVGKVQGFPLRTPVSSSSFTDRSLFWLDPGLTQVEPAPRAG